MSRSLRREFELFSERFERLELAKLREANAVLEAKVARLEKVAEDAKQLPVILDRLNKLEEERRESQKRTWQSFFAAIGVAFGVLGGVIGQLILSAVKPTAAIPPK